MFNFDHLKKINLSYTQHFVQASKIFINLQTSAVKLVIHAFFPDAFPDCVHDFVKFYGGTQKFSAGPAETCEKE